LGNNNTNYTKRLIRHQKVIGRKEFRLLWSKYAEPGGKRISSKNAKKFLKDFVIAVKIKYDPQEAKRLLLEGDPMMTGFIDEDQFTNLFIATTKIFAKHDLYLSASLAGRQKKILKENDRDAGSGSVPSSHIDTKQVRPHSEIIIQRPSQKQKQPEVEIEVEASHHLVMSELDDSNAKSDLSYSFSVLTVEKNLENSQ